MSEALCGWLICGDLTRPCMAKAGHKGSNHFDAAYYARKVEWNARRYNVDRNPRVRFLNEYKISLGCEVCGYDKYPHALDLDHRNPLDKVAMLSYMMLHPRKYSDEQFIDELLKCRVLCANCHRIKSYDEGDHRIRRPQD